MPNSDGRTYHSGGSEHPTLGIHLRLTLIAVEFPRVVHGRIERQRQHVLVQAARVVRRWQQHAHAAENKFALLARVEYVSRAHEEVAAPDAADVEGVLVVLALDQLQAMSGLRVGPVLDHGRERSAFYVGFEVAFGAGVEEPVRVELADAAFDGVEFGACLEGQWGGVAGVGWGEGSGETEAGGVKKVFAFHTGVVF